MSRLRHLVLRRKVAIDQTLHLVLEQLALKEQRSPDELATRLLEEGLQHRKIETDLWHRWQTLSPRERDVTALTCLGYTNRQIASQLSVAPETIKTHMRHILVKFNMRNKADLHAALSKWDFSAWGDPNI